MPLPRDVGVVLVAAGRGERAGVGAPKQYRAIAGVPMLLRALRPFTSHPSVGQVVVVLPPADAAVPPPWLAAMIGSALVVAAGGEARQASVAAGLAVLSPACTIVVVHDAARPFVAAAVIDAVIAVARSGSAALAALPLGDTLKEEDPAAPGWAIRTLPRDRLWRAQTPQAFPRALLQRAHAEAVRAGAIATDDAALVERLGERVRLVPDSVRNVKVTTPDDFIMAERLAGGTA